MKDRRLVTNVSDAFWCSIVNGASRFSPAEITLDDKREPVSWLDRLFEGGIRIPEAAGRPLTMLLTGPPGSGKSTLAMEMCYRMRWGQASPSEGLFRLYISLESESQRLIDNAVNIGFHGAPKGIVQCDGSRVRGDVLAVWGRERMDRLRAGEASARRDPHYLVKLTDFMAEWFARGVLPPQPIQNTMEIVSRATAAVRSTKKSRLLDPKKAFKVMAQSIPEVLVIDSLNVIGAENQPRSFEEFLSRVPKETKLVIFVLDAAPGSGAHPNWEFVCDIVVRMGYEAVHNYYTRTIEIVKARYQGHVWGKHQLKIYAKPVLPDKNDPDRTDKMLRAHPYRDQGGIFVFPSLHYYLSLYKRRAPEDGRRGTKVEGVDPGCRGLADAVTFPRGRCTAFIGVRGGHKSHLAYLHLLNRIVSSENEAALVISLREDEQRSYSTMQGILREMDRPSDKISHYRSQNQLEVLYYHPGYITPEEFFHRMFISIQRLKQGGQRSLTVMFNSLDQLGAKFPLCARQDGFVAGIIEALAGENATSIFIAVDEPGQPAEQYGLLATADLILSFYPYTFTEYEYRQHLLDPEHRRRLARRDRLTKSAAQRIKRDEIVLQVVRYAGGIRAGARGLLELVDDPGKSLHDKKGLHFTRLNPRGFTGTPVLDRTGSKSAARDKD